MQRDQKKVIIREYDGEKDFKVVEKLERDLEIGSRRGLSILTNMMGDPLCRVRLYPTHIMLVAELVGERERTVVGVVRGCIKFVGSGLGGGNVRMSCILGLRMSPKHRRLGIGRKLVKSIEEWAIHNGAQYLFIATEENNIASINLFTHKRNYTRLTSLTIIVQPIDINTKKNFSKKNISNNIKIEKLSIEHALSLYRDRIGDNKLFPFDIDSILKSQHSLGTWVAYFKEEHDNDNDFISSVPSSWTILSIWKTYECYKLQIKGAPLVKCFHATLSHIGSKVLPNCLKVFPSHDFFSSTPFGFIFLYGLYGEGENAGDLMRSLWSFACNLGRTLKDCKAIVSELGVDDPLNAFLPWGSSTLRINDVWLLKKITDDNDNINEDDGLVKAQLSHVFVDPRDF